MKSASDLPIAPKTVLVVDDEVAVLTVVACMLQGGGYNVILAPNADTAVHIAGQQSESIDLALLDVVMPDAARITPPGFPTSVSAKPCWPGSN